MHMQTFRSCIEILQKLNVYSLEAELVFAAYEFVRSCILICQNLHVDLAKLACEFIKTCI